ncbi:hypothetical protein MKX03_005309, partial [Papaver bracteatum]
GLPGGKNGATSGGYANQGRVREVGSGSGIAGGVDAYDGGAAGPNDGREDQCRHAAPPHPLGYREWS